MSKKTLFWILAVLITIGTGYYQRKTGPSHPKKVKVSLNDNQYSFNMPRSSEGTADCPVSIEVQDTSLQGEILFRRYPTSDPWEKTSFTFKDKKL